MYGSFPLQYFTAFKDRPASPPSRAQAVGLEQESEVDDYMGSMKRLMTNKGYILLLITYGLNVGVFYAISTLLNTTILMHFQVGESDENEITRVFLSSLSSANKRHGGKAGLIFVHTIFGYNGKCSPCLNLFHML